MGMGAAPTDGQIILLKGIIGAGRDKSAPTVYWYVGGTGAASGVGSGTASER